MNAIFSKPLREFFSSEGEVDDAAVISVDSKGIDIRVRQGAQVKYILKLLTANHEAVVSQLKTFLFFLKFLKFVLLCSSIFRGWHLMYLTRF